MGTSSAGQASGLETQRRAGTAAQSRAFWKQKASFLGEPLSFLPRPSPDWMRPTHMVECNLSYLTPKSIDFNVSYL